MLRFVTTHITDGIDRIDDPEPDARSDMLSRKLGFLSQNTINTAASMGSSSAVIISCAEDIITSPPVPVTAQPVELCQLSAQYQNQNKH